MLFSIAVSLCGRLPSRCEPGIARMQPLCRVLSLMATHALTVGADS